MKKETLLFFLLFLVGVFGLNAQSTVTGTVTSSEGEALIGVNILEVGTSNGAVTDLDGKYSISVADGANLQFSYTGYEPQTMEVAGQTTVNVTMAEGVALSEVVVTALGISREKKGLTYSVDQVDGEEFTRVKNANVINTLAGKTAGISITRGGTGVGSSAKVVLRGNKSNTNNQPLYVIDGIPMTNRNTGTQSGVFGGGVDGGDGISNLNPEDIESMSILKGASAAALYGSQAANGVILITTKKGSSGKPRISFSSTYLSETVNGIPELQYKYGQTSPGAEFSWGAGVSAPDHVTDFFQTGNTFINSLSISGGKEDMQSYFSYSNTSGKGVVPTNELERHNVSFNQAAQFYDNKLKLNASFNYINQKVDNRPAGGLYFNPLTGLYFFPRGLDFNEYKNNFELYNPDRNFNTQNWVADRDIQQNPYWILNRNLNNNTRNRFISSITARYDVTDWLYVQARGNIDKSLDNYEQKVFATTQATLSDFNGRYVLRNSDDTQIYGDIFLGINKQLSEDLTLDVTLGASHRKREVYQILADSKNGDLSFANKFGLQYIKDPIQAQTLKEELFRRKENAVFGSAQLGYKSMLYFDITARNDWSSALPTTSYFYPSFGLSVILSEMIDVDFIDYLKIRGSYAIVGNDVPPYVTNEREDKGQVVNGQLELSGVGPIPGTVLQPEESKSFELGLEFRTWNNRLSLDLTYYKNNTINQFIPVLPSPGTNFTQYLVNAGNIQNSGIEATLGVNILQGGDFTWDANIVYTKNTNEVIEVHEQYDDNEAPYFITDEAVNSYKMGIKKGGSFGDIYVVQFERDAAGKILIDADGKPKKGEFGLAGNPNPDYMIGFSNQFSFKGVFLSFLIDGRFGGKVLSMTEALLDEYGVSKRTADARDVGFVTIDGVSEVDGSAVTSIDPETFYGAVGGRNGITENYVYDATNIRLRELSLGYSLPASMFEGSNFFESVRISIVGRNLFFFKNDAPFDPDVTFSTGVGLQGIDIFSLPATRSIGFNLSVGF